MYCSSCGKEIPADARFCVHCGVPVPGAPAPGIFGHATPPFSGLYRSRSQRMIAGLCGGMSATYGWDLSLVRLITVLGAIFSGPIIISAYLVAWMIVPEEPFIISPPAPAPVTPPTADAPPASPTV